MPCEEGLSIYVKKFISIHETPCFHFCIQEHNKGFVSKPLLKEGENNYQSLKRRKIKMHKISKEGSRIAFDSEQKAYENLLFLKRRQLRHLNRDIEFINTLITYGSDKQFKDIPIVGSFRTVPDSHELVHEHYVFN
tara:strand:+ start:82 stop:489 length:408 start_codon:yes stop_codon:yes gene_type:complete